MLLAVAKEPLPDPLPKKSFSQANTNIPARSDYSAGLDEDYWSHWTKRTYKELTPATSWVCPNKLWDVANRLCYADYDGRLRRAIQRLGTGADIGCKGDGRLPTSRPNSDTASKFGTRVADSLQSWIKKAFVLVLCSLMKCHGSHTL